MDDAFWLMAVSLADTRLVSAEILDALALAVDCAALAVVSSVYLLARTQSDAA